MKIRFSAQDGVWFVIVILLAIGWWYQWSDSELKQRALFAVINHDREEYSESIELLTKERNRLREELTEAKKNQRPIDNTPGSSAKP